MHKVKYILQIWVQCPYIEDLIEIISEDDTGDDYDNNKNGLIDALIGIGVSTSLVTTTLFGGIITAVGLEGTTAILQFANMVNQILEIIDTIRDLIEFIENIINLLDILTQTYTDEFDYTFEESITYPSGICFLSCTATIKVNIQAFFVLDLNVLNIVLNGFDSRLEGSLSVLLENDCTVSAFYQDEAYQLYQWDSRTDGGFSDYVTLLDRDEFTVSYLPWIKFTSAIGMT